MCDITQFTENAERLEDYLEHVNTDVDRLMAYEPTLYAAYLTLNPRLGLEYIKSWYKEAEEMYVSATGLDVYLGIKYDVWEGEDIDYYYEKEVHRDGTLAECGGYWFRTER